MFKLTFDAQGFCRINGRLFMRRDIDGLTVAAMSGNYAACIAAAAAIDSAYLLPPLMNERGRATWLVVIDCGADLQPDMSEAAPIAFDDPVSPYWIWRASRGWFEVCCNGATHSKRVGTYHFASDPARALGLAMADINRRISEAAFSAQVSA